jgi:hypothetical protein
LFEKKYYFEDLDADGRIILKRMAWATIIWLIRGTGGGLMYRR